MQAVEMSYLRSSCGVSSMDGKSNESVYEHFGMCHVGEGKKLLILYTSLQIIFCFTQYLFLLI